MDQRLRVKKLPNFCSEKIKKDNEVQENEKEQIAILGIAFHCKVKIFKISSSIFACLFWAFFF